MTMPGIEPIITSAMAAVTGNDAPLTKGRDFATGLDWCTETRTILDKISKCGNRVSPVGAGSSYPL
jgi:hypothetical protein